MISDEAALDWLHRLAFEVMAIADLFEGPTAANLSRISMDLFAEFERVVNKSP